MARRMTIAMTVMTTSRIHRLTLTHFRNYRAASLEARGDMVVLVGAERRRQDQLPGGDLVPRRRAAACAAPRWRTSPTTRATAPGRCRPRSRARSASPRSAPASTPPRGDGHRDQPALPDRPRAGRLGRRLRRSSAHGLADAGDGRAVHWARPRSGGASSTAWCSRSTASIPAGSRRWSARCARATGCWKCATTTTIGATRSSARPPNSRSRSRRRAARPRRSSRRCCARAAHASAFPSAQIALDGWMENALLDEPATAVEDRYRADAARQPRPRRRGGPHARRAASDRPAGDLRAEEHAGARCLDRRAEGAPDRPRAGACHAGRRR